MKIDPETFSNGLADVIEKVVRPLRDEIAATRKSVRLTAGDAAGLGEDLGAETRKQIERAVAPLVARLASLENRPAVDFRGVYDETDAYKRGDVVTDQSAVWFCCDDTTSRPGKSASWKLMLKSGR